MSRQDLRDVPPHQVPVRLARLGQPDGVRDRVGDLGPDRRPHRPAQGDLHRRRWCGASPPSARRCRSRSRCCSFCRAVVGVGEGAYGPSANALLCAAAPPEKRGRALGIYNIGMAFGGTSGLVLGNVLALEDGWRNVFWIAGGPVDPARASARRSWRRPARLDAPDQAPRPRLPAVADLSDGARGRHPVDVRRQRAGRLVAQADHRGATLLDRPSAASTWPASGWCAASGGVVAGGYCGRRAQPPRGAAATRCAIGLSADRAVPFGVASLLVTHKPTFMVLTAITVFLLSVYNGPSAAVVDELGPPAVRAPRCRRSDVLDPRARQRPRRPVVGWIADRSSVVARAADRRSSPSAIAGVLFMIVARRQRKRGEPRVTTTQQYYDRFSPRPTTTSATAATTA